MCYSNDETEDSNMAKRPVHEIRMGRIRAAIWENGRESRRTEGASAPDSTGDGAEAPTRSRASRPQNGTRHNVTFSRLYHDGEQWKDSSSFGRDDLPLLAKVADQVHSWIYQQTQSQSQSKPEGQDENF